MYIILLHNNNNSNNNNNNCKNMINLYAQFEENINKKKDKNYIKKKKKKKMLMTSKQNFKLPTNTDRQHTRLSHVLCNAAGS